MQLRKNKSSFVGIAPNTTVAQNGVNTENLEKSMIHSRVIKNFKTTSFLFKKNGVDHFEKLQKIREQLLKEMLRIFNEGRSKRCYCIAATVFEFDELQNIIKEATEKSKDLDLKEKSKVIHSLLDSAAQEKGYLLKLRK